MLKQTINFEDFDGLTQTETLYFNLTKTEITDNLHLKDRLEKLTNDLSGVSRELTIPEVESLLDLVKTFMRLSYGLRSEDGKRFIKGEQVWTEFTQTSAYDSFLFSLFEEPDKAMAFLVGILPAELRVAAEAEVKKAEQTPVVVAPTAPAIISQPFIEKKPQDMTREELLAAFQAKNQQ